MYNLVICKHIFVLHMHIKITHIHTNLVTLPTQKRLDSAQKFYSFVWRSKTFFYIMVNYTHIVHTHTSDIWLHMHTSLHVELKENFHCIFCYNLAIYTHIFQLQMKKESNVQIWLYTQLWLCNSDKVGQC